MRRRSPLASRAFAPFWALGLLGCGDGSVPSSFASNPEPAPVARDAGPDAGRRPGEGLIDDVTGPSTTSDPTLGGRCADDAQCDDGIECTVDRCDPDLERCRFVPDDAFCQDGVYCNGVEVCTQARGCRPGEVVQCDDKTSCTIDRCLEAERACVHEPRDADGDGDVDAHCAGHTDAATATDCDDTDPTVSGLQREVCGNGKDDDCDLETDEFDCDSPRYDQCSDALPVTASATFALSTLAAQADMGSSCAPANVSDVFVDVFVEDGPKDVVLTLSGASDALALGAFGQCGDAKSETACHAAVLDPEGRGTARLLLRSLPAGHHPVAVYGAPGLDLELTVAFEPPSEDPGFETCGHSGGLVSGEPTTVDLFGAEQDVQSECATGQGDRVYHFVVDEPSDAHVYANSLDGLGEPMLSLRGDDCAKDEAHCVKGDPAELFARGLAPGEHSLSVSSSLPGRVSLLLELDPQSEAPAGDDCSAPPELAPGKVTNTTLTDYADDVSLGCLTGARDAVFRLSLDQASDVLLVLRLTDGDTGAVAIAPAGKCKRSEALGCESSDISPLRLLERRLLPGAYDVVVESSLAAPVQLVAFTRPTSAPIVATSAENCETVIDVPAGGGSFQGNTAGAVADFSAGCDLGGLGEFGAADQLLHLVLDQPRRVFLDSGQSAYDTLLDLRQGPECPGKEIACAGSSEPPPGYLDVLLDPGEYFLQVDGYAGAEGQWFLDIFEAEP